MSRSSMDKAVRVRAELGLSYAGRNRMPYALIYEN